MRTYNYRLSQLSKRGQEDQDPLTIAALIFAAVAAISSTIQLARGIRKDKEQERRQIENSIFSSFRQLYRLKGCHERFRSYMDQYQHTDSPLGIGSAPLPPDPKIRKEIRDLSGEIIDIGLALSDELTRLGDVIADSDYKEELQSLILQLDKDFQTIREAKTYRDYHKEIDIIINKIEHVLREVAGAFNVRAPE